MADITTAAVLYRKEGGGPHPVTAADFATAALTLTPAHSSAVNLLQYHVLIGSGLYEAAAVGRAILGAEPVNPQNVEVAARAVGLPTFGRLRYTTEGKVFTPTVEQRADLTY
ncbi:hypothetical protein DN069_13685 [Streptacidiphilus pinicola]|uniref:Uncharacterized protein n=1 Tax=Streptacidiphilus pinicola TaxID=2219663 RepID=A0A2X0KDL8_9ACTN|nr:hypothetical protein [Streptacidiphilus pinicola]RAG85010.1 hypothetical protein DN069_13685 [Streptacidiphilus pinicola]